MVMVGNQNSVKVEGRKIMLNSRSKRRLRHHLKLLETMSNFSVQHVFSNDNLSKPFIQNNFYMVNNPLYFLILHMNVLLG